MRRFGKDRESQSNEMITLNMEHGSPSQTSVSQPLKQLVLRAWGQIVFCSDCAVSLSFLHAYRPTSLYASLRLLKIPMYTIMIDEGIKVQHLFSCIFFEFCFCFHFESCA